MRTNHWDGEFEPIFNGKTTVGGVGWVERSEPHTHEVKEIGLSMKSGSP
jgi:hypothetical protein